MRTSRSCFPLALLAIAFASGCNLPTVSVYPTNGYSDHEFTPLPAATVQLTASALTEGSLQPFCDVRSGKAVRDENVLAKVSAGIKDWQRINKKEPAKPVAPPAAVDPDRSPVSVNSRGVSVRLPGVGPSTPVKHYTDHDPRWFAVSCAGDKITVTLEDQAVDLDVLYTRDDPDAPELWLAGYSLKTKVVFTARLSPTKPYRPDPSNVFYTYDLSRYLSEKVEPPQLVFKKGSGGRGSGSLRLYFLDNGHAAGLQFVSEETNAEVGRFTVVASAAQ
jgi:hypothetical protein